MAANSNATKLQGKLIDTTAPTNGQVLQYVSASSKYVPTTPSGGSSTPTYAVYEYTILGNDASTYVPSTISLTQSSGSITHDATNNSFTLPINTKWEVDFSIWDDGAAGATQTISLNAFITNTASGTTQSLSGSAVINPNTNSGQGMPNLPVSYAQAGGFPGYYLPFVQAKTYITVGSVAKFLRIKNNGAYSGSGSDSIKYIMKLTKLV